MTIPRRTFRYGEFNISLWKEDEYFIDAVIETPDGNYRHRAIFDASPTITNFTPTWIAHRLTEECEHMRHLREKYGPEGRRA